MARAGTTEGGTVGSGIGATMGGMRATMTRGGMRTTGTTLRATVIRVSGTKDGNICRGGAISEGVTHLSGTISSVTWLWVRGEVFEHVYCHRNEYTFYCAFETERFWECECRPYSRRQSSMFLRLYNKCTASVGYMTF